MTAALIYQHATAGADQAIAEGIGMQVKTYRASKSGESSASEGDAD